MALMNCPECGKGISSKAVSCPNCGCPINKQSNNLEEEYLCCPKCHSKELHSEHKGFSGGKALAGAILTGGIGLLAGTIGSKDVQITCLKCGKKFKAGEALSSLEIQRASNINKTAELPQGVNIHNQETFTKYNYKCPLCNKTYNGDLHNCPKCGRFFLDSDKTNESILDKKRGGCMSCIFMFTILGAILYAII